MFLYDGLFIMMKLKCVPSGHIVGRKCVYDGFSYRRYDLWILHTCRTYGTDKILLCFFLPTTCSYGTKFHLILYRNHVEFPFGRFMFLYDGLFIMMKLTFVPSGHIIGRKCVYGGFSCRRYDLWILHTCSNYGTD
jgi:hypothetical protein